MQVMGQQYGRGNKAYEDEEVKRFLKEKGIAKTNEIAEEFEVSDVAIRKRLDELSGVDSRKIRNRKVYFVPHEVAPGATSDGHGTVFGLSVGGLSPVGGATAKVAGLLTLLFAVGSLWVPYLQQAATVMVVLALMGLYVMFKYQDVADPSFELKDWERSINVETSGGEDE